MDLLKIICTFHSLYIFSIVIFASEAMKNDFDINQAGIRRQGHFNGGSLAENACERYTKQACDGKYRARSLFGNPGHRLENIVGGRKVQSKEIPHMAALGSYNYSRHWYCGASLISSRYVVTAAHCVTGMIPANVRLGDLNVWSEHDDASAIVAKVIKWIIHPDYTDSPNFIDDIALVKFEALSGFTDHIRPICLNLYGSIPKPHQKLTTAGWGSTTFRGSGSDDLLSVEVELVNSESCKRLLPFTDKSMICAGYLEGGKDACEGDSGGPLHVLNLRSSCSVPIYSLVGVVSKGYGCAWKDAPGMYTRISSFIRWIENIVWK